MTNENVAPENTLSSVLSVLDNGATNIGESATYSIDQDIFAVEKIVAVDVAKLKAVLAHAEFDVIGKASHTWAAIKNLIAIAEGAV